MYIFVVKVVFIYLEDLILVLRFKIVIKRIIFRREYLERLGGFEIIVFEGLVKE